MTMTQRYCVTQPFWVSAGAHHPSEGEPCRHPVTTRGGRGARNTGSIAAVDSRLTDPDAAPRAILLATLAVVAASFCWGLNAVIAKGAFEAGIPPRASPRRGPWWRASR